MAGLTKCIECDVSFTNDFQRKRHMLKHSEERLQCPACFRVFIREDSYLRHYKNFHVYEPGQPIAEPSHVKIQKKKNFKKINQAKALYQPPFAQDPQYSPSSNWQLPPRTKDLPPIPLKPPTEPMMTTTETIPYVDLSTVDQSVVQQLTNTIVLHTSTTQGGLNLETTTTTPCGEPLDSSPQPVTTTLEVINPDEVTQPNEPEFMKIQEVEIPTQNTTQVAVETNDISMVMESQAPKNESSFPSTSPLDLPIDNVDLPEPISFSTTNPPMDDISHGVDLDDTDYAALASLWTVSKLEKSTQTDLDMMTIDRLLSLHQPTINTRQPEQHVIELSSGSTHEINIKLQIKHN
jgi:uncharacterized C2H2 Zn-finger protein